MHPLQPTVERQLYIDQNNISHIISAIHWEGNLLKGTVETALTETGKNMQGLIRQGSQVAFSMRGLGPVCEKQGDITYVKDPLHILTFDWVIHPSHRPAYMEKIVSEDYTPFNIKKSESSYFIPLTESEIKSFIKDESKNVKTISEQYEFNPNDIFAIDKKRNLVYLQEHNNTLAVYLEDYIANELDSYLANF